ncbi:MAG TPA: 30S ribosomal protein S18 [Pseudobdellovibrionaceae bacterium]|nr:30S ribosomal protein S18 [Pseudobdellovibrionaceae bacterium]
MKKTVRSKYRPEFPGDYFFDYKDAQTLGRFISEGGKITPARISKLSLAQQKRVAAAVKKARNLGLLPLGNEAYDFQERPEGISPKPFSL